MRHITKLERTPLGEDGSYWLILWLLGGGMDRVFIPPQPPATARPYLIATSTERYRLHRWYRIQMADGKCEFCGCRPGVLHVHHLTYIRLGGNELPEDWIVLCPWHHGIEELRKMTCSACGRHPSLAAAERAWKKLLQYANISRGKLNDSNVWVRALERVKRDMGYYCPAHKP